MYGPLYPLCHEHMHSQLQHHAQLLPPRLHQHQLQQQQHRLPQGRDLTHQEENLVDQRFHRQTCEHERPPLVEKQVLDELDAVQPALREVYQRLKGDRAKSIRVGRHQVVALDELPSALLLETDEELHVLVIRLALAFVVRAFDDDGARVLDGLQQFLQVVISRDESPHQENVVILHLDHPLTPPPRMHLLPKIIGDLREPAQTTLQLLLRQIAQEVDVESRVQAEEVRLENSHRVSEEMLVVAQEPRMGEEPIGDETVTALLLGELLHAGKQTHVELVLPARGQPLHLRHQLEEDRPASLHQGLTLDGEPTGQVLCPQLLPDLGTLV